MSKLTIQKTTLRTLHVRSALRTGVEIPSDTLRPTTPTCDACPAPSRNGLTCPPHGSLKCAPG